MENVFSSIVSLFVHATAFFAGCFEAAARFATAAVQDQAPHVSRKKAADPYSSERERRSLICASLLQSTYSPLAANAMMTATSIANACIPSLPYLSISYHVFCKCPVKHCQVLVK